MFRRSSVRSRRSSLSSSPRNLSNRNTTTPTMMKTHPNARKLAPLAALIGVFAFSGFSGGCAGTRTHDSTGEYVDDTGITTKVKTALLRDDAVKSFEIKVETMRGVVQLSGFVDNENQKNAASRDAASVAGVRNVSNNLIVK